MTPGDDYRLKAAFLKAKAEREPDFMLRAEFEHLAISYLRLAEQADRNAGTDITYGEIIPPRRKGDEPA